MEDQSPESPVVKEESGMASKRPPEVKTQRRLISRDKVEGSVETGYGSAPPSSVMSGAEVMSESPIWTSEDREHEALRTETKLLEYRRKSPTKPSEDSGSTSQSPGTEELEDKASRLKSLKKLSPSKQMAAASVQSGEEGISTASQWSESAGDEISLVKSELVQEKDSGESKSRGKIFGSKVKPLKKQTAVSSEEQPPASDPGKSSKATKSTKEKSAKSPGKGGRSFRSLFSPKRPSEGRNIEIEQSQESEMQEKVAKSPSPSKRKLFQKFKRGKSKSPGKKEAASARSEPSDAKTLLPDPAQVGKAEKSPGKHKSMFKSPFGKAKSRAKQEAATASFHPQKLSSRESFSSGGSHQSLASATELAKHVKSVALSGPKKSDEMALTEEPMETSYSEDIGGKTCGDESKGAGIQKRVEASIDKDLGKWTIKRVLHTAGVKHERVRRSTLESSIEETPTDVSTLSDSSGIHGGSESKKGSASSSGTQSQASGLEAEPESEEEHAARKPVQRQKRVNVESPDSDEESEKYRSICGSPLKKAPPPPPRQDAEDSDKE